MSVVILNVLCEGQTEEKFVKEVLRPYLSSFGIIVKHRLLLTSKKKNIGGGIISYKQVKRDLDLWQKEVSRNEYERNFFTTMFDFYALPQDFPGMSLVHEVLDKYEQIALIENNMKSDIASESFIPYIQLHEFEALLFCDIAKLSIEYPKCTRQINALTRILDGYDGNPELINSGASTAPSKRIIKALENKYSYNKPLSGISVVKQIGIETLLLKCRHFSEWIEKIKMIQS